MARNIFKPWYAAFSVLSAELKEGEFAISSDDGALVRRPDGDPDGDLEVLGNFVQATDPVLVGKTQFKRLENSSSTDTVTLRFWSTTSDTGYDLAQSQNILSVLPNNGAGHTGSGTLLEARGSNHLVLGLRGNGSTDSFAIIGKYDPDTVDNNDSDRPYTKLLFLVNSDGRTRVAERIGTGFKTVDGVAPPEEVGSSLHLHNNEYGSVSARLTCYHSSHAWPFRFWQPWLMYSNGDLAMRITRDPAEAASHGRSADEPLPLNTPGIANFCDVMTISRSPTTGLVDGWYWRAGGSFESIPYVKWGITETELSARVPILPGTDAALSLGDATHRWSEVYASSGTIQTSDANLKTDIEDLDEAELRVAVRLKGLLKKFRMKDAVAKKGDDARIHVGVIAQEVISAFEAEGLDPFRYAMVCKDTFYLTGKHDGTGKLGEDGVAIDGLPIYSRTPIEGVEPIVRLSIRYDELLAFIIAAL